MRAGEYKNKGRSKGTSYDMKVINRMAELWNESRWMTGDEIAAQLNAEFKEDHLDLSKGKVMGLIDRARNQPDMPKFIMRGQRNGRAKHRAGATAIKRAVPYKRGENSNPIGPDLGKVKRQKSSNPNKGDKSFNQRYTRHGNQMAPPAGAHERAMQDYESKRVQAFKPLEDAKPVSYANLLDHHCKWPIDGPDGKTWYCGRDKVKDARQPYCATHTRRS